MRPSRIVPTAAVLIAVALGGGVAAAAPNDKATVEPPGVQTFPIPDRHHVQGTVDYPQNPPVGGPHNPVWQNCGFYSHPVTNENAVHSLEHGVVWITYAPDLPAAAVTTLRSLATQPHLLISAYVGLPSPVVASAWGKQLQLDDATDPRLQAFVDAFSFGQQAPEPHGPCERGVGDPD
ncbi:MAG TPA: DUF3105 domain-containing protein [Mycobacterium sp.]|jgi:hypothetical protein